MSPSHSPSPSANNDPKLNNSNFAGLPPLNTNHPRRPNLQRPLSYAKSRMSSYSNQSNASQTRSRPGSYAFPHFHSSLPYALVRDFAYPMIHPYHYGPPPEPSGVPSGASTPSGEHQRRLSDPPNATWDTGNSQWAPGPWGGDGIHTSDERLPQMAYREGPPYSEDEDLHSPVIISSRHKKHKSSFPAISGGNGKGKARSLRRGEGEEDEDYFDGSNGAQTRSYGVQGVNGYHGGLVTYPPDHVDESTLAPSRYTGHRDSHFATMLPNRTYGQEEEDSESSDEDQSELPDASNDSRYSKDYQFTIASPDEEMHGKAVALFDFARENENELPLVEGQVIWVSYRHGQGWLVAEDPKTGDKGLVPEEYVRLLRDIEGGWNSLSGDASNERDILSPDAAEPQSAVTPTEADAIPIPTSHHNNGNGNGNGNGNNGSDKRPPIVSTFSTSSKDLDPYPQHLLDKQAGRLPPQVVHYGSQANTPTLTSPTHGSNFSRGTNEASPLGKGSITKNAADESEDTGDSDDSHDEFHDSKEQQHRA
ncbi:MAG: hypothetical protein L6R39_007641 [Caloplaca ligustica]|nr:MAG: hypothetical protein L6R39_007641 [Caloplaca ligustica]